MKIAALLLWHLSACLQAHARRSSPLPPPEFDEAIDNGTYGYYPYREYVTTPKWKFMTPETNFPQWSQECDDGLLTFLTPRGHALPHPGPLILDARGELIWGHHFENSFGGQAYDFMVQNYKGEDYLTFWLGDDRIRGHGSGFYYMLNSSYDVVRKIGGANGMSADLHEFLITPEGTALMTLYEITPGDVSMFRKFDPKENADDRDPNYIWDCVFQEIDLESGDLLFEWRASDHYSVTETYRPIWDMGNRVNPFDWYHINSIQRDELNNYLISARYPHSVSYIDGKTKEIIWQLGGRRNDFMDLSGGNATNFAWQHDARFHPTNIFPSIYTPPPERPGLTTKLLTFFDNAAEDQHYDYGMPLSRGLLLEITYPTPGTRKATSKPPASVDVDLSKRDLQSMFNVQKMLMINGSDPDYTVRVIKSYEHPEWVRSSSQGNMQVLPQGPGEDAKVLVGYGLNAVWTEFSANGTVLCDAHFGAQTSWERGDVQSYRNYKFAWTGRPETKPSVEISDSDAKVDVSWLGATDVVEWVLQGSTVKSNDDTVWTDLRRVPKVTFETSIPVSVFGSGAARYLRVLALAEDGTRLNYGTSRIIDRGMVASYFPGISQHLPKNVSRMTPLKFFLIVVFNVSALFIIYELYRRYLVWRQGRAGAGPLLWRKGPAYRLLADV